MTNTDKVLDRITYDPGQREHSLGINWPDGLAPTGVAAPRGQQVPAADVLVITWTAAEARALADVLTPGTQSTQWVYYSENWDTYEVQLTNRSPARESHRLCSWASVSIGGRKVVCCKFELHPATDAPSLPTAQLAAQLAGQVSPKLVVTTGTAGGAGAGTNLGDVNVASAVRADFTTRLKGNPWSNGGWQTTPAGAGQESRLATVAELAPEVQLPGTDGQLVLWHGVTVSTDFFAFDAADDHYGLRAYEPGIRAVEMDDAAIAVGVAAHVPFMSVRNASDPVMPDGSEASARQAEEIYRKYGYDTTVRSALATWALIAGMDD